MKYRSVIPNVVLWEIEMDLINDLEIQLNKRLEELGYTVKSKDSIYDYYMLQFRKISRDKRVIRKSKEFECPNEYKLALQEIEEKIENGDDLTPYLSKEILNMESEDDLLNDWGIHHLHLSRRMGKDGFIKRSDYQIFAYFTQDSCYFLKIYRHNKRNVYSSQELIKIIDENWPTLLGDNSFEGNLSVLLDDDNYEKLRRLHVNSFVQVKHNRIAGSLGGGYTTNGKSISSLRKSMFWHRFCKVIQNDIIKFFTDDLFLLKCKNIKLHTFTFDIHLLKIINEKIFFLYDRNNNIMFEMNYESKYMKVSSVADLMYER